MARLEGPFRSSPKSNTSGKTWVSNSPRKTVARQLAFSLGPLAGQNQSPLGCYGSVAPGQSFVDPGDIPRGDSWGGGNAIRDNAISIDNVEGDAHARI